jgi:hypothetical protein
VYIIQQAGIALDKTDNTQLYKALQRIGRIKLTGNLNMYLSPTGSDSNNGLTSGTPMKTAQAAVNAIYNNYDLQCNHSVVINYAPGTYDQKVTVVYPPPGAGPGSAITFLGNISNPASVVIAPSTAGTAFYTYLGANIYVQGMTIGVPNGTSSLGGVSGNCISAACGGAVTFDHVIFGGTQRAHVEAGIGGFIVGSSYTINGASDYHLIAGMGEVALSQTTVTLVGTPNFRAAFAWSTSGGFIWVPQVTFAGTATGQRYIANTGGVIMTNTGSTTYLPGSIAGDATGGGLPGYYG